MVFIIIVAIIAYFILIAWTWESLDSMEQTKKIVFILIGFILMYCITLIVFNIAKHGITYQNEEIQNNVRNVLVAVFTGINGIIVMPQMAKILDKIDNNQIEKNEFVKRILILIIIFIICLIFEVGYMQDTQEGIMKVYYTKKIAIPNF